MRHKKPYNKIKNRINTKNGRAYIYSLDDEYGREVRLLEVDGVFQSATYVPKVVCAPKSVGVSNFWQRFKRNTRSPGISTEMPGDVFDMPFETYRAFDYAVSAYSKPTSVLMLGGGAFTYPKYLLAHHPETMVIDVVEPDHAMEEIAREFFYLDDACKQFDPTNSRLRIFNTTAQKYLKDYARSTERTSKIFLNHFSSVNNSEKYNVIINDAFLGSTPCQQLLDFQILEYAKTCLTPDGIYVLNFADEAHTAPINATPFFKSRAKSRFNQKAELKAIADANASVLSTANFDANASSLQNVIDTLNFVFEYVHVIPCADATFSGASPCVVVATDGEYSFPTESYIQKWM